MTCKCFSISETCYHYKAQLSSENVLIADWRCVLARYTNAGVLACVFCICAVIKATDGVTNASTAFIGHLKSNQGGKIKREKPEALALPTEINQVWLMDFVSDNLKDGRSLRTINVIDDYNREGQGVEVGLYLLAARVIRALGRIIVWHACGDTL